MCFREPHFLASLIFSSAQKFEFTTPRSRPVPCTYVDTPTHGVGRHDMCLETWSTRTRTSAAATSSVSVMNFSPSLIWLRNCSHIARRFCRAAATHSPKQRCVVSLYALARQPLRQSCNTPLSPHVHMHVHPNTSKWLRTNCITSSVHAWGAQARLDTLSTAGVEGVQRANASIDESCVSQPRTPPPSCCFALIVHLCVQLFGCAWPQISTPALLASRTWSGFVAVIVSGPKRFALFLLPFATCSFTARWRRALPGIRRLCRL